MDESLPSEIEVIDPRNTFQTPVERYKKWDSGSTATSQVLDSPNTFSHSWGMESAAQEWITRSAQRPAAGITSALARY